MPLDLLGSEPDRIARRLAFLDAQTNAGDIEYEQANAHLDDCLALAVHRQDGRRNLEPTPMMSSV